MNKQIKFIFIFLCISLSSSFCMAEIEQNQVQNNIIAKFKAKRKAFYNRRKKLIDQYNRLTEAISVSNNRSFKRSPEEQQTNDKRKVLPTAITLIAISYLLYLLLSYKREKYFLSKKNCLLVLIFAIGTSIFIKSAYSQDEITASDKDFFIEKITEAHKVLNANNFDKAIMKLERKKQSVISIPANIAFKKPIINAKLTVKVESSEYFYLLAALYYLKNNELQIQYNIEKLYNKQLSDINTRERRKNISLNIINYYLLRNKREEALAWGNLLIENSRGFEDIIKSLDFCMNNHLDGPAIQALEKIAKLRLNKNQRTKAFNKGLILIRHVISNQNIEFATRATLISQDFAYCLAHSMKLADFAYSNHLTNTAQSIIDQSIEKYHNTGQLLQIADLLLKWKNEKKAEDIIDRSIENARTSNELMDILWFCIRRNLTDKALTAAQTLLQYFPKAVAKEVPSPGLIYSSSQMPTNEKIKILTLIGALYLKKENLNIATSYFRKAVEMDIDRFITEGGFNEKINLNDLFYLMQAYISMNDLNMIKSIDPIYTALEKEYIKQLEDKIQRLKQNIQNLSAESKLEVAMHSGLDEIKPLIAFWGWVIFVAFLPWLLDFFYMTYKNWDKYLSR